MQVSVIMPTYNCGRFIASSIESVLAQTVHDWEIQIVDDCSTDNTEEIIQPYLETYRTIHYYKLPGNRGPAVARTEAIKRASGKYIAFLDSDDLWMPEKLEKQIRFMEEKQAAFSCTAYACIDGYGRDIHMIRVPPEKTDYKKMIRLSNPVGNLTVMYNQEKLGKYEVPMIEKRNDFALWLKILHDETYCYGMPDILALYRMGRPGSVSYNKLKQAKYHWELYRKIEKHGVLRSMYEVGCWAFVKGIGFGLNRNEKRYVWENCK